MVEDVYADIGDEEYSTVELTSVQKQTFAAMRASKHVR